MKKNYHSENKYVSKFPNYEFYHKLATGKFNEIYEIDRRIVYHFINWRKYQSQKEWKAFYDDLEYDHAFIQWIFPNFFKSMFNYNSYRLTVDELNKMKESPEIMGALKQNTEMIERFLGISNDEHNRFKECVVRDTHNRLRIRRILACLKVFDQKQECDFFLNTMIEKLQQQKEPKRFEHVIQLFKQYEDDISLKNINQYMQEDINYDKIEKYKFYQHFNIINEMKQDQMVLEEAPAQQSQQKEQNLIGVGSEQQNEKQENDKINAHSQFDENLKSTNDDSEQFKDINQAKTTDPKQQGQAPYKKEFSKNMIQPKQVEEDDEINFEEVNHNQQDQKQQMEEEAQPFQKDQQVQQFDGIYVKEQLQQNEIANIPKQPIEQESIKHKDEQLNDEVNKLEQKHDEAKL